MKLGSATKELLKRRAKAIGTFPDGQSALMLVYTRLRHVAETQWGIRHYMKMNHLTIFEENLPSESIVG